MIDDNKVVPQGTASLLLALRLSRPSSFWSASSFHPPSVSLPWHSADRFYSLLVLHRFVCKSPRAMKLLSMLYCVILARYLLYHVTNGRRRPLRWGE